MIISSVSEGFSVNKEPGTLISKVRESIKRYHLLDKGDRVVIGVSGGPDSIALLDVLQKLKDEFSCVLHIAHLDHGLRRASRKDSIFVEQLGAKFHVPVMVKRIPIESYRKGQSLEEEAREKRLAFLCDVARRVKAHKVALAHHLDDQAETVLMRILRGTGLAGLTGIMPKRMLYGVTFIRPFLGASRREIEGYIKANKLKFRVDATNKKDIYFRNKVRHHLLPMLSRDYNKNIAVVLSSLAESASSDYDYLNQQAQFLSERLGFRIPLKRFLNLHPSLQRLIMRLRIRGLKKDTRRITFNHIKEIEDLVYFRPKGSIVDLPQGISVKKTKTHLYFFRK
jgi:tRNA(Ile)-lysidine synthase